MLKIIFGWKLLNRVESFQLITKILHFQSDCIDEDISICNVEMLLNQVDMVYGELQLVAWKLFLILEIGSGIISGAKGVLVWDRYWVVNLSARWLSLALCDSLSYTC